MKKLFAIAMPFAICSTLLGQTMPTMEIFGRSSVDPFEIIRNIAIAVLGIYVISKVVSKMKK